MKIKKFNESQDIKPKMGDYAMCQDYKPFDSNIADFLSSHIGYVIGKSNDVVSDIYYEFAVAYETAELEQYFPSPENIVSYFYEIPSSYRWKMEDKNFKLDYKYNYFRPFDIEEIMRTGETKEELELLINVEKYNL